MNIDIKLHPRKIPLKEYILKQLEQPEVAEGYFKAALDDFEKNGNIRTLLLVMKDISKAQGGIKELVAWTNLSPKDLTYLLNPKHPPQMNEVLKILSRLKTLSPQK